MKDLPPLSCLIYTALSVTLFCRFHSLLHSLFLSFLSPFLLSLVLSLSFCLFLSLIHIPSLILPLALWVLQSSVPKRSLVRSTRRVKVLLGNQG